MFSVDVNPSSLAAILAALVLAACSGRLAYRHDQHVRLERELPSEVKLVRVRLFEGALTFQTGSEGKMVLEAVVRRAADTEAGLAALQEIDIQPSVVEDPAGTLTVLGPAVAGHLDRFAHRLIFKARIEVPAGVKVEGITNLGHMAAVGRKAPVELETAQGDVQLGACQGDALIRTGKGIVMIHGHRGSLDVWSHDCSTMQVHVEEIGAAGIKLATDKGSIQARLPAMARFTLDAWTHAGRAANGFDLPVTAFEGKKDGKRMRGDAGGGGPPVSVSTQVGHIAISRASP